MLLESFLHVSALVALPERCSAVPFALYDIPAHGCACSGLLAELRPLQPKPLCALGSAPQPVSHFAEHFADDLEVSLEADMCEAFNVELEDDSAREACPVLANLHYS